MAVTTAGLDATTKTVTAKAARAGKVVPAALCTIAATA
jgi:hypothetical protein